jgi:hypothetical protein
MKKGFASVAVLAGLVLIPAIASAVPITISGSGALGSFTGDFDFSASPDGSSGVITINLTNTSPAANGGFITGFAFNLPSGVELTSATLASSSATFDELLGATEFDDGVNGQPHGDFDIGASIGSSYLGSGSPLGGIGVGSSVTFTFSLFAAAGELTGLTAADFLAALSDPRGDSKVGEDFVVRFRGFVNGGSDKVPNGPPPDRDVPEPATGLLFGLGLASLVASRFGRRS